MKRRRLLISVGAVSASVSGCIGPNMPKDAVVRMDRESPPADASPVSYDDLPEAERRLARAAVEDGLYHACPELPDALRSFAQRFEDPESAYVAYRGASYAVWIRIADTIGPRTAAPPERDPSCGVI